MTKWEYCVLAGVSASRNHGGLRTYYPKLFRLTANGIERITGFDNRPQGVSEEKAVAQMISQLGEEVWELVFGQHFGETDTGQHDDSSMWFKRPKP